MSGSNIIKTTGAILQGMVNRGRNLKGIWHENQRRVAAREFENAHPVSADDWALVCPFNIGDVYLYAGLAGALRKYRGGSRVTFFTKPHQAFISSLFPSVDAVIPVHPPVEINRLGRYVLSPQPLNRGHLLQPPWNTLVMMGCRGTTFLDTMRGTLQLPWDAEFEKPRPPDPREIEQATQLLVAAGCRPGRSIILCPDANTTANMTQIPGEFWLTLVQQLRARGYDPVTNLGPTTKELAGSTGIKIPLDLFRALAVAGGAIMANRSGLCDLVSDLPIPLHAFYPPVDWYGGRFIDVARLEKMGLSTTAREFEVNSQNFSSILQASLESLFLS